MHAIYHCVLLSLDVAATFAAWIGRGEDQMIRHPVPRVTTKTETTMMVSFIKIRSRFSDVLPEGPLAGVWGVKPRQRAFFSRQKTPTLSPAEGYIYIHKITRSSDRIIFLFPSPAQISTWAWRTLLASIKKIARQREVEHFSKCSHIPAQWWATMLFWVGFGLALQEAQE